MSEIVFSYFSLDEFRYYGYLSVLCIWHSSNEMIFSTSSVRPDSQKKKSNDFNSYYNQNKKIVLNICEDIAIKMQIILYIDFLSLQKISF